MEILPYIIAYLATTILVIAVIARFLMWSKMPMHIRWELYPVAHEGKKAAYGGSYLEESEWWKKPREVSLLGELKVMIPEILFLVALKEHNPKLWLRSFPFHFGLYMVIGCVASLAGAGILVAIWPTIMVSWFAGFIHYTVLILGVGGLCLGLLGALGLLQRRLSHPDLKDFTSGADIFNLVFFIVAFAMSLITFIVVDPDFSKASFFVYNLITFKMAAIPGNGVDLVLPWLTVLLFCGLVVYVPLTHMSHFVGKYFAYHAIRWNDKPNLQGGKEEPVIGDLLGRPVSWAASHINAGKNPNGRKSWAEVCTEINMEEKKK
jgi:nitrate reductase gamma subunit